MTPPRHRSNSLWGSRAMAYVTTTMLTLAVGIGAVALACGYSRRLVAGGILASVPLGTGLVFGAAAVIDHRRHPRLRLRLRYQSHPRPALVLTDTPRPGCPHCHGQGWWTEYVQDGPSPEDGERIDVQCDCWSSWHLALIPVPRRLANRRDQDTGGFSDEPPF